MQDGCDYFCSYCTIPFARGRRRNGTIASMVEQAGQAAAEGGKIASIYKTGLHRTEKEADKMNAFVMPFFPNYSGFYFNTGYFQ